jgi:flagellar hook-length control protein FliK
MAAERALPLAPSMANVANVARASSGSGAASKSASADVASGEKTSPSFGSVMGRVHEQSGSDTADATDNATGQGKAEWPTQADAGAAVPLESERAGLQNEDVGAEVDAHALLAQAPAEGVPVLAPLLTAAQNTTVPATTPEIGAIAKSLISTNQVEVPVLGLPGSGAVNSAQGTDSLPANVLATEALAALPQQPLVATSAEVLRQLTASIAADRALGPIAGVSAHAAAVPLADAGVVQQAGPITTDIRFQMMTPAGPVPIPQLPEQLVAMIRQHAGGRGEARIQLHPSELGALDLQMKQDGQRIELSIVVDSEQSRRLLAEQLGNWRERMSDAGFSLAQMDVSVRDQNAGHAANSQNYDGHSEHATGEAEEGVNNLANSVLVNSERAFDFYA